MSKQRNDLIGQTGTVTRQITVLDAKEADDGSIDIYVSDSMGNVFWTEMDGDISLD